MNFELSHKLDKLLVSKKLDEAIQLAEHELKKIPTTDFHIVIGRNLLHLVSELANFIKEFDKSTKAVLKKKQGLIKKLFSSATKAKPAAYYCEMNGFTINNDRWYIDLFSFEYYSMADLEWLSDFYDSSANGFTITGFEDLQNAFEDVHKNNNLEETNTDKAFEICELLVILRLQELFREAYKLNEGEWDKIPMFVTAHDYELIYKVN